MSANPVAKLSFWLATSILAHGIALVLGLGLAVITAFGFWGWVGCQPHISDNPACSLWWNVAVGLAFLVCGLVFGGVQGLMLHYQRVIPAGLWIAVTTLGWAIGLMVGYSIYMTSGSNLMRFIAFGMTGLAPGLAQWFIMKRYVS